MKSLIAVVVVTAVIYIGALFINPYAHALSIELALRHIFYLGQFQQVLGQVFTAIPLAAVVTLTLSLAGFRHATLHTLIGATLASGIGLIIVPSWPSHNFVYIAGELAFIIAAGVIAWGTAVALTTRSTPTPSARP